MEFECYSGFIDGKQFDCYHRFHLEFQFICISLLCILPMFNLQFKLGKHRSNALELIEKQPIIEVDGDIAVCDGGGGALGHPLEYIKLGARADYDEKNGEVGEDGGVSCIYCGLKYRKKGGSH
jgi:NADH dehydrogenase (ubiquinone) Fe-S protein 6